MVALTKKSANLPQGPLRVCAQNHRYRLGAERCSKSISQANLRRPTYDECNRLGSCSKDPIGYEDGANRYAYVGNASLSLVDPIGLQCFGPYLLTGPAGMVVKYKYGPNWHLFYNFLGHGALGFSVLGYGEVREYVSNNSLTVSGLSAHHNQER
jgi:uncharacterized protein RhaS with RHS repeats